MDVSLCSLELAAGRWCVLTSLVTTVNLEVGGSRRKEANF